MRKGLTARLARGICEASRALFRGYCERFKFRPGQERGEGNEG